MDNELHLACGPDTLAKLLKKIIDAGEASKIDLKSIFDLSTAKHKAEFLKDVSAIANTYSYHYKNHGFIIFGAEKGNLMHTTFPDNDDHLQATIDQLIRTNIGPFITTHLSIFKDDDKQWGVLVIPPTKNPPHVFIRNIQDRSRGEIFIRKGTTTEKAQPEDFSRFFQQHLEEYSHDFQQKIFDIQRKITELDLQLKKVKVLPRKGEKIRSVENIKKSATAQPAESLVEIIKTLLAKEEDPIAKGLFLEARKITSFLESDTIPWNIGPSNKKQSEDILSKIESISNEFWLAIINLLLKDEKGDYNDAIVNVISYLAKQTESPLGSPYTEQGKDIRYYPLFVALYIITIIGVARKRDHLLKRIFKIELQGRSHYDEPLPITNVLFYIRRADDIFHPLYNNYPQQKWCDPSSSYTKLLIDKILKPDDPTWDQEREFYNGEYVLCIAPMDTIDKETKEPIRNRPSVGLYIFASSAIPIITRFLKNEKNWLPKIFERPLNDLLSEFDKTANNIGLSSGCWKDGFAQGALEISFPKKKEQ